MVEQEKNIGEKQKYMWRRFNMKRYLITDSNGNHLYEAYFESEELAHNLAKDNGILDYQIFELKTQYELFMDFLKSHSKTLEDIKYITTYSFSGEKYNISIEWYVKDIEHTYESQIWKDVNIIMEDGVILVTSRFDYEYERLNNNFKYIDLTKGEKNWEER